MHANDWKKTPRPAFNDLDKPKVVSREVPELDDTTSATPSSLAIGEVFCHTCKQRFISEARYSRHILSCVKPENKLTTTSPPTTPRMREQGEIAPTVAPVDQSHKVSLQVPPPRLPQPASMTDNLQTSPLQIISLNTKPPVPVTSPALPVQTPNTLNANAGNFVCNIGGCGRTYKSEQTLKHHQIDIHAPPAHTPPAQTLNTQNASAGNFVCNIGGCKRTYKSEKALKQHKTDVHGSGGQALDLYGKDAWMLNQRERERLKQQGLLRYPPIAARGAARGGYRGGHRGNRGGRAAPAPMQNRASFPPQRPQHLPYPPVAHRPYQPTLDAVAPNGPQPRPTSQNMGGQLEMEQAKLICGKTMRLLLQTDIFIHHDGKISIGGILWTRIGVERQRDAVGMFDGLCQLPRVLQSEYLPAPKTFASEYTVQYPVSEFESAPARNPGKVRCDIISVACSRIVLEDGRHEVIKMAAVDVLTGRVLMSHLVCTNPHAKVTNWQSPVTGFASFRDIEDARQAGYRVLKGWTAARAALFSFMDKDTIIVGHNLRAELDALRIIHGRAIDMVKVVEKAAGGPLSKAQVNLDSWCRDVANVASFATDPAFGRDCLMNAFAARELSLWVLKNREEFEKKAKQKTKEYQMVM
ncbi:hypothetical protein G6514_008400 [Epicoccum nigrum]|nr:hypothetical protein G6514_008400 [Epicoccum nigrum]